MAGCQSKWISNKHDTWAQITSWNLNVHVYRFGSFPSAVVSLMQLMKSWEVYLESIWIYRSLGLETCTLDCKTSPLIGHSWPCIEGPTRPSHRAVSSDLDDASSRSTLDDCKMPHWRIHRRIPTPNSISLHHIHIRKYKEWVWLFDDAFTSFDMNILGHVRHGLPILELDLGSKSWSYQQTRSNHRKHGINVIEYAHRICDGSTIAAFGIPRLSSG